MFFCWGQALDAQIEHFLEHLAKWHCFFCKGQHSFNSCAIFKTFATVFLEHGTLNAMLRLLNPKLARRKISRYLVMMMTPFIIDLHNDCV